MKNVVMKVSKQAAMNPVARAMARQRLEEVTRDAKIAIWDFREGDDAKKQLTSIGHTCGMALCAIGFDHKHNDPEFAVAITCISEAMQLIMASAPGFKWKHEWVVPLDDALDAITLVTPKLTPQAINVGVKEMSPRPGRRAHV
jgi:hypothetical protein